MKPDQALAYFRCFGCRSRRPSYRRVVSKVATNGRPSGFRTASMPSSAARSACSQDAIEPWGRVRGRAYTGRLPG